MKLKQIAVVLALSSVAVASQAAEAPIDTTAVIAGVDAAKTAILAVIGALTGLSVSIFGVSKVYGFIKRKAGA